MPKLSQKLIWPNLFLIGVPRSGTTALYLYLQQHPDIFMTPSKEPGFFIADGALYDLEDRHAEQPSYFLTTIDAYQALFRHLGQERIIGDATPHYFYHQKAAQRIAHYAPNADIIAILRSPAERMHSHYMMEIRDGHERLSFPEFVQKAQRRDDMPQLRNSYYFTHLKHFYDLMPAAKIHIILYEDFQQTPAAVVKKLYEKLNVDANFTPEIQGKPNRSGVPKSRFAHKLVMKSLDHRLMRLIHLHGPPRLGHHLENMRNRYFDYYLKPQKLSKQMALALNHDVFREDILKLQKLIGRDLSHWLP